MKPFVIVLTLTLLALQYKLWFGEGSVMTVRELQQQLKQQQVANQKARHTNQQLDAQIADLKNGSEALEEKARYELGMVKQGETYYHIID